MRLGVDTKLPFTPGKSSCATALSKVMIHEALDYPLNKQTRTGARLIFCLTHPSAWICKAKENCNNDS
jgi:hypothetical protein